MSAQSRLPELGEELSSLAGQSRGALYVATGARHRREAADSIRALAAIMPQLPILFFTENEEGLGEDLPATVVRVLNPEYEYIDKVRHMAVSPFQRTLFLDTDTLVTEPLDEVFEILDRFEVVGAHELARIHHNFPDVPRSFPEINSGVLGYRNSPGVDALFRAWIDRYLEVRDIVGGDQDVLRWALYHSQVQIGILPPEYNAQVRQVGCVNGRVKVLHGRNIDLLPLEKRINRSHGQRVFIASADRGVRVMELSTARMKSWSAFYVARRWILDILGSLFGGMVFPIYRALGRHRSKAVERVEPLPDSTAEPKGTRS